MSTATLRHIGIVACFCVAFVFGFRWIGHESQPPTVVFQSASVSPAGVAESIGSTVNETCQNCSTEVFNQLGHVPIEDVRVGMRVIARNPEVSSDERARFVAPDRKTCKLVKLELAGDSPDKLIVETIRPTEWLVEHHVAIGNSVYLDMPELGAEGDALVTFVGDCPPIEEGDGNVVISTFAHSFNEGVVKLQFATSDRNEVEIGVTTTHPFWSQDRQQFVPAGQLEIDEQVLSATGTCATLVAKSPLPSQRVYNLEVAGEHVFFVSPASLLVHNQGCGDVLYRRMSKAEYAQLVKKGGKTLTNLNRERKFLSTKQSYPDDLAARRLPGEYDVLVKVTLKEGGLEKLIKKASYHDGSQSALLAKNPAAKAQKSFKGRAADSVIEFKVEKGTVNLGFGKDAISELNSLIKNIETIN